MRGMRLVAGEGVGGGLGLAKRGSSRADDTADSVPAAGGSNTVVGSRASGSGSRAVISIGLEGEALVSSSGRVEGGSSEAAGSADVSSTASVETAIDLGAGVDSALLLSGNAGSSLRSESLVATEGAALSEAGSEGVGGGVGEVGALLLSAEDGVATDGESGAGSLGAEELGSSSVRVGDVGLGEAGGGSGGRGGSSSGRLDASDTALLEGSGGLNLGAGDLGAASNDGVTVVGGGGDGLESHGHDGEGGEAGLEGRHREGR